VSELLQNAASGGVRDRGKGGVQSRARILNHTVQYNGTIWPDASAFDEFETDTREQELGGAAVGLGAIHEDVVDR
jgi:hypothetical protein